MHYKRVRRHGSAEYRWGGKIVGRACLYCERPGVAKEMCYRHYQMARKHGDPLYAEKRKKGGLPYGTCLRKGYEVEMSPVADIPRADPATDPRIEKSDRRHAKAFDNHGLRMPGGRPRKRREYTHRRVVKAKTGDIVHHIDGRYRNNNIENLHVFKSPKEHG